MIDLTQLKKGDFIYVNHKGDHMYMRLSSKIGSGEESISLFYDHLWGLTMIPKMKGDGSPFIDKILYDMTKNLCLGDGVMYIPCKETSVAIALVKPDSEIYNALAAGATGISIARPA